MKDLIKTLKDLGLSEKEAKIYIIISKIGPNKARNIAITAKINRVQLYSILKSLQKKGLIEATFEQPSRYSAVPFDEVLDLFIKTKEEEVNILNSKKNSILSQWKLLPIENTQKHNSRFMVLQGRKYIYSKINQMVSQTKKTINIVTSNPGVLQAFQAGLFDAGFAHPLRDKIHFCFLTNNIGLTPGLAIIKELLIRSKKSSMCVETRITNLGAIDFPRFVIIDDKELIFFLKPTEDHSATNREDTGLWTNNKVLVHAFQAFFEELWKNANDFEKKIEEIEKQIFKKNEVN